MRLKPILPLLLAAALAACGAVPGPTEAPVQTAAPIPILSKAPIIAPSPEPSPEPEPTPEPSPKTRAETMLDDMSLEEKIGQMFFLAFRGAGVTEMNADIESAIRDYGIGGVALFKENIVGEEQCRAFIADMQGAAKIPLFIGIDEEGGAVSRTGALGYETVPPAAGMGDADGALRYGRLIGGYLKNLGFTVDFAPVADINTNPDNPVIGSRAFGADAETVSEMASAFMAGLRENGIFAAAKHFPGHGDTAEDSHTGMAATNHGLDRLRAVELAPFQALIDAGAEFVMVGHISAPKVTGNDEPAIFSELLLTGILRGEMGFEGAAITDALDMGAVVKFYSPGEAAVKAVSAGIDILLMPKDFREAHAALLEAVRDGTVGEARIDEAVLRILRLKFPEW